ncbi:MAG: response regulator [Chromatiaceae bacterium]|nr:response regulator [Chromatiaceae bacterium]
MQSTAKHILVVDDDNKLRDLVIRYLSGEGFAVSGVADGASMDRHLDKNPVDLIVLDLMLPGEDGLSIARRLRSTTNTPIIILSARGDEVDRIVGLEVGADDYLPKPFNPRELLARIRAVLRRLDGQMAEQEVAAEEKQYSFGDFTLDIRSQSLIRDNEVVDLTAGDFALLEAFASRPNRIMSRDGLIELLKGYERSPYDRSIDVRVTRLRKKIEPNPEHPQYIRTIWGKGYMFTPQGNPVPQ